MHAAPHGLGNSKSTDGLNSLYTKSIQPTGLTSTKSPEPYKFDTK